MCLKSSFCFTDKVTVITFQSFKTLMFSVQVNFSNSIFKRFLYTDRGRFTHSLYFYWNLIVFRVFSINIIFSEVSLDLVSISFSKVISLSSRSVKVDCYGCLGSYSIYQICSHADEFLFLDLWWAHLWILFLFKVCQKMSSSSFNSLFSCLSFIIKNFCENKHHSLDFIFEYLVWTKSKLWTAQFFRLGRGLGSYWTLLFIVDGMWVMVQLVAYSNSLYCKFY